MNEEELQRKKRELLRQNMEIEDWNLKIKSITQKYYLRD
jgi:hypothetical protein